MNRISPLLQKLSELYLSKVRNQHLQDGMIQTGDIDSIMRHTRSAYSELLEWQRTMSEIEAVMLQENSGSSSSSNGFQTLPQQAPAPAAAASRAPKQAPASLPKPEPAVRRAAAPPPPPPPPTPEPEVEEEEEVSTGDSFYDDDTNPSGYAAMPEYVEEQPEEEEEYTAPAPPPPPPARVAPRPAPAPQSAPVAAVTQQVNAEPPMPRPRAAAPAAGSVSDIRELVTVNDKYLFVSELFNHNRTAYEKAMEAINKFRSRIQATNWVNALVKKEYKWEDDSPTAKAFYKVINQYFAAR